MQPERGGAAPRRPNILFVMTDQQRADTIASLGNAAIYTPNLDRLVQRGAAFTQAYSPCPVCVAARYSIMTGCLPPTTGIYGNSQPDLTPGQAAGMEQRCGPYLARSLRSQGYRTFGIGKFHTSPTDEDLGFDVHVHSEELYGTPEGRARDDYAAFIAKRHPEYDWVEALMGERTEMYYMPQMSPMPAAITVEAWAADRAIEQIGRRDERPYFGFVSFVGPHPPFAPPLPFNRLYDPDRLPGPVRGDPAVDLMDEYVRWMNHAIWAEDINDPHARVLKARYYGEITYIDRCLGRILDAVEARPDADNTLICFFSDHGDHLGDHRSWQKESYFDAACRVPFLVSWPARLPKDVRREEPASLVDLFAVAASAAGRPEERDGIDLLAVLEGRRAPRERSLGYYGKPGSPLFKVMVREGDWKYIFLANGAREQLFNLRDDPSEVRQRIREQPDAADRLRQAAVQACRRPNVDRALDGDHLRAFAFAPMPDQRIYQFDQSRGVTGFPARPADVLDRWPQP